MSDKYSNAHNLSSSQDGSATKVYHYDESTSNLYTDEMRKFEATLNKLPLSTTANIIN